MHPSWHTGTTQLRRDTVVQIGNSGWHVVALSLWQSGVALAALNGGLPLPVHTAIFGLSHVIY